MEGRGKWNFYCMLVMHSIHIYTHKTGTCTHRHKCKYTYMHIHMPLQTYTHSHDCTHIVHTYVHMIAVLALLTTHSCTLGKCRWCSEHGELSSFIYEKGQ